jgi:hypothetical protein
MSRVAAPTMTTSGAPGPASGRILGPVSLGSGESIYYYELHETDDELYTDVLLAHDAEYDEDEFLALVLEAREAVIDRFEQDSLTEAVAAELARRHGFLPIDDAQLRAAVNVSATEGETRTVPVEERRARIEEPEAEDYRSLLIEREPDDSVWRD